MEQAVMDAAAAVEGVAQELEGIGRSGSAKMLRNAFDTLLGVDTSADLPPADDATRRTVARAWDRYQQGVRATDVADLKCENADLIERNFACGQQLEEMSDALMGFERSTRRAERDVLAERRRQLEEEGWTPEHDDGHTDESLAMAAACYAAPRQIGDGIDWPIGPKGRPSMLHGGAKLRSAWPWSEPMKPSPCRRSDLVKAGALILAEIERLDRANQP